MGDTAQRPLDKTLKYIDIIVRREDGGESVQIGIYHPRLYTFADVQETLEPKARTVRRTSCTFAPICEQSSRMYGPEYGRKCSTEGSLEII